MTIWNAVTETYWLHYRFIVSLFVDGDSCRNIKILYQCCMVTRILLWHLEEGCTMRWSPSSVLKSSEKDLSSSIFYHAR